TGALIVIERSIILNRYIDVGVAIDGQVSSGLLHAIFQTSSPIHDGAVIIQGGRIAAAGCFLPLARDIEMDQFLGTRHRAGLGVSQETDAVVVLVSEEKGQISLAVDGKIDKDLSEARLKSRLRKLMQDPSKKPMEASEEELVEATDEK
ncbi:MAG: DNA integrity scanning protein DisA nucleotide-binding domain protein, partial [Oligoflexales bacterium]|nr:DNA integrity scanning protein DisA nucleotide-binding domain protein [Oligoflexales bacterium]